MFLMATRCVSSMKKTEWRLTAMISLREKGGEVPSDVPLLSYRVASMPI